MSCSSRDNRPTPSRACSSALCELNNRSTRLLLYQNLILNFRFTSHELITAVVKNQLHQRVCQHIEHYPAFRYDIFHRTNPKSRIQYEIFHTGTVVPNFNLRQLDGYYSWITLQLDGYYSWLLQLGLTAGWLLRQTTPSSRL